MTVLDGLPADHEAAVRVWHAANVARLLPPSIDRVARIWEKLAESQACLVIGHLVADRDVVAMALAEPGRAEHGAGAVTCTCSLCLRSLGVLVPQQDPRPHARRVVAAHADIERLLCAGRGVGLGHNNGQERQLDVALRIGCAHHDVVSAHRRAATSEALRNDACARMLLFAFSMTSVGSPRPISS